MEVKEKAVDRLGVVEATVVQVVDNQDNKVVLVVEILPQSLHH
jgi:hypothetical protein